MILQSTSQYICKRIEIRVSKRYLHTHIHSSTTRNRQEGEATQISINTWTDRPNVAYIQHTIKYDAAWKGRKSLRVPYNTSEPRGHYAKWDKPVTKRQISHDLMETMSTMAASSGRGDRARERWSSGGKSFQFTGGELLEVNDTDLTLLERTLKNG